MKKIFLILIVFICTSFIDFPCHPAGDKGPCTHRVHYRDHLPCTHYNWWGYPVHDYDIYPCSHRMHSFDWYPCFHECY